MRRIWWSVAAIWLWSCGAAFGQDSWSGFGRNSQHSALTTVPAQDLNRIHWQTPVDLAPLYASNGELLIHYGSPLVTAGNTVIIPVKTGLTAGFRVEAHRGTDGALKWSRASDCMLPPHQWIPVFGPVIAPRRVYFPGAGGTIYFRDDPDLEDATQGQSAFYGLDSYQANSSTYNTNVMINTPLTSDLAGNIYFGFVVLGPTPVPLQSGIARISASGAGSWVSVTAVSGDSTMLEVAQNCARRSARIKARCTSWSATDRRDTWRR